MMKKLMMMAVTMAMTISANAMSYTQAKNEALFLSDKMAYELNLTDAQYDAVYEINLDYMMSVNGGSDVFGVWWNRRNQDLQYVLTAWQYSKYAGQNYFYRPLSWTAGAWTFNIYSHYANRSHFYKARPTVFVSYKGGNNRKADRFYADRRVTKPTAKPASVTKPTQSSGTWRIAASRSSNHGSIGSNRQMAQSTNKNGRFGGSR